MSSNRNYSDPRNGEWVWQEPVARGGWRQRDSNSDADWRQRDQYDYGRDSASWNHGHDSREVAWTTGLDSGRGKGKPDDDRVSEQASHSSKGRGKGKPSIGDYTPTVGNTLRFRSDRHAFYDKFPNGTKDDDETAPTEPVEVLEVKTAPITHWCKKSRKNVTRSFIAVRFKADNDQEYWTNFSCDGLAYMSVVKGVQPFKTGWFW